MKLGIIGYGNIAKAMVAGLDGKFNLNICKRSQTSIKKSL
jgi:Pyrroline-5-carboxylate reductase